MRSLRSPTWTAGWVKFEVARPDVRADSETSSPGDDIFRGITVEVSSRVGGVSRPQVRAMRLFAQHDRGPLVAAALTRRPQVRKTKFFPLHHRGLRVWAAPTRIFGFRPHRPSVTRACPYECWGTHLGARYAPVTPFFFLISSHFQRLSVGQPMNVDQNRAYRWKEESASFHIFCSPRSLRQKEQNVIRR